MSSDFHFLDNYAELLERLLGRVKAITFLDAQHLPIWTKGVAPAAQIVQAAVESMTKARDTTFAREFTSGTHRQLLFALGAEDGKRRGYCLITLPAASRSTLNLRAMTKQLAPLLECVARELGSLESTRKRTEVLSERTTEMEWLLKVSAAPTSSGDNGELVATLVGAAGERLGAEITGLLVPEKRMTLI
ncbi:MAG: hypothetical protein ACREMY_30605, partial [bacterium]